MVPADIAARAERERLKARRKEERRKPRSHHAVKNAEKPFIMWDGEGPRDAGYALFGSSDGDEICHPFLETRECLNLLLDCEERNPDAIHVAFGFNYDVSMILRELSVRHLTALKHWNQTEWEGYRLEHIPHKWFQVRKDGLTVKVFDIRSFFSGGYVRALTDMKIGTKEQIGRLTTGKAGRSEFMWAEIGEIKEYWKLELTLGPVMCEKLRDCFLDSGFDVRSWHGPGALANMAMRKHKVPDAMAETPPDVRVAARFAFAGGRFEMFRGGYTERTVYSADIRSAYPYFATQLPNLARGKWHRGRDYEPDRFGVYRIRYQSPPDPMRPYPLFRRADGGNVVWAHECEGWYWGPEAALVADDPDAQFLESWVFHEADAGDRPFAWLQEYYDRRQYLKRTGSPLELSFKLIINSCYGQLAQRSGWDRKKRQSPRSHQLEWAGYITSACRAAVFSAGKEHGSDIVSYDTDGIYSLRPFSGLVTDPGLGNWEIEQWDGGIFWQSGIYALRRGDEWVKGKSRGISKGAYQPEDLITALRSGEPLRLKKKQFTGYGLAVPHQLERLNTWTEEPHVITFGGEGKRYHNTAKWCGKKGCADGMHDFIARPLRWNPQDGIESQPHYLPWLANDPLAESAKRLMGDLVAYDANHLELGEEWVREYA